MSTSIELKENTVSHTEPQTALLISFKNNNLDKFVDILKNNIGSRIDINHLYEDPDKKTLLEIACSCQNKIEFVQLLLEYGADVNLLNEFHGKAPIHWAVLNSDYHTLKVLVEDKNIDINKSDSSGQTALHLAIQQKKEDFIDLLQKHPTFVNKSEKIQTSINIDMRDDHTDTEDCSIWVEDTNIDLDESENLELQMPNPSDTSNENLFSLLYTRNIEAFESKANADNVHYCDDNKLTYLQYACKFGLISFVRVLLYLQVDPNKTTKKCRSTPIMIAAYNCHFDIIKMLVDTKRIIYNLDNGDNILHALFIGVFMRDNNSEVTNRKRTSENKDFYHCLEYLLDNISISQLDVNLLNHRNKTVLHYAISMDNREIIGLLLQKGAYLGIANAEGEMSIKSIKASTLEYFMDKSISTKNFFRRRIPCICLDYNLIVRKNLNSAAIFEIKPLVVISEVTQLRPLLKHPFFGAFLEWKWYIMMKKLALVNYLFYSIFVLFHSSYLLVTYAPITTKLASENNASLKNSIINEGRDQKNMILWYIVVIFNTVLFFREFLQFIIHSVSDKYRYIKNFEIWIEVPLIIVTYVILYFRIESAENRTLLTVIAIFLSWLELMLLILSHPSTAIYITMFKAVVWNSLKFLLCYVILIVAFALCFYLLLHDASPEFENIMLAVFKTWVMATGEYQVSSNPFEKDVGIRHLFFVLFLFLIPIVLFNLLNGIAVSDIQSIRQDAELVNIVSRVKLIARMEEIISHLLSFLDKVAYYYITLIRRYSDSEAKEYCNLLRQLFFQYINLFSAISKDGKIYILTYENNSVFMKIRKFEGNQSVQSDVTRIFLKLSISAAVVEAIQKKLYERASNRSNNHEDTGVPRATLLEFKDALITLKNASKRTEDRLEIIEQKLSEISEILKKNCNT